MNLDEVTRVEVIDQNGRSYVNWNSNNNVQLDLQDNGRTLKVFIKRIKYELNYCHECIQMTNHLDNVCQKCKK